ncbi:MAG: ferrous iron transport protein A [Deltaproteobacteria bacterium]|nr:ferrous iron transport protein A [Deltaproteobacteria bacterium]MBW2362840.1 ferrous iron transport protein A [Deltaproteobacteria bacterium]
MTCATSCPRGPAIPLTLVPQGPAVEVCFFSLDDHAASRLRDLGIREGAEIHIISNQQGMIVGIGASRIAIPADLAAGVFVEEMPQR